MVTFASVDWLTVTAQAGTSRVVLARKGQDAMQNALAAGLRTREWHFMGYHGWQAPHMRVGERADSTIVMLSGEGAACYWREFAGEGDNITRIDLAVTCELDQSDPRVVLRHWATIAPMGEMNKDWKWAASLIQNNAGGQTLYIGSRTSSACGRIYDKGLESGDGMERGALWRWEVELKKPIAKPITRALYEAASTDYIPQIISGYVYDWFEYHKCAPLFPKSENVLLYEVEAIATTDESSLHWLSTQVKPTVGRLIGNGRLDDTLKALGLDGACQPRTYILPQAG